MFEKSPPPQIKRILAWSGGLGIYVSKEAKILKWKRGDYVRLTVQGEKLIVERLKT